MQIKLFKVASENQ